VGLMVAVEGWMWRGCECPAPGIPAEVCAMVWQEAGWLGGCICSPCVSKNLRYRPRV
jgi:hypothetical protein